MTQPATGKSDRKIFGCLGGCLGVVLVLVLVLAGTGYYLFKRAGLTIVSREDTATVATAEQPAIALRVNLEAPTAFSPGMLEGPNSHYTGTLLRTFLPYEFTLGIGADETQNNAQFRGGVSFRRAAQMFMGQVHAFGTALERQGRHFEDISVSPENPGLGILAGKLELPPEAATLRSEAWPTPIQGTQPQFEMTHFLELLVDNRQGDAGLAIAALAQTLGEDPANDVDIPANSMLAPDPMAPLPPLSLLSQVRIIKGARFLKTAWLAVDFEPNADATLQLRISGADEVSALFLMTGLGRLPEELGKQLASSGVLVEGEITREGVEISGKLHFKNVGPALVAAMEAYNETAGQDFPSWFPIPSNYKPAGPQANAGGAHG